MPETLKHMVHPKYLHMTLFGFSAGIPYFLIFSSLSLWLDQVGVEKSAITYFSWAALGYSFKFLWAPLIDRLPVPWLTAEMGQRRGWLVLIQLLIITAICWMGFTDPALGDNALTRMALAVTLLGFSAATQDILIDAWRIEASDEKDITMLSSVYIVGYRVGMITSGAGALFLADYFGTSLDSYKYSAWQASYLIMALCMLVGLATTFTVKEPKKASQLIYKTSDYLAVLLVFVIAVITLIICYQLSSDIFSTVQDQIKALFNNKPLASILATSGQLILAMCAAVLVASLVAKTPVVNQVMIKEVYWKPVADLFRRHRKHLWLVLGIICTYKISDIVMGVTANLFYQEKGFTLGEIAGIAKTFGLFMTLTGGLAGGFLVLRYGIMKMMILGAILSAGSNLMFMVMAFNTKNLLLLTYAISIDNFAQGLAGAVFVGFLSMLVNRQFTAVQYAMLSSVMTLFPKILGGYSGGMVEQMGFGNFYLMTAAIGIPVILMLIYAINVNAFDFAQKTVKIKKIESK